MNVQALMTVPKSPTAGVTTPRGPTSVCVTVVTYKKMTLVQVWLQRCHDVLCLHQFSGNKE